MYKFKLLLRRQSVLYHIGNSGHLNGNETAAFLTFYLKAILYLLSATRRTAEPWRTSYREPNLFFCIYVFKYTKGLKLLAF